MKYRIKEVIVSLFAVLSIPSVSSNELWIHVYNFNEYNDKEELINYEGFVDINRIVQNKGWIYTVLKRESSYFYNGPIVGQSTFAIAVNCNKKLVRERGIFLWARSGNGLWALSDTDSEPIESESVEGIYQFICMEWAK